MIDHSHAAYWDEKDQCYRTVSCSEPYHWKIVADREVTLISYRKYESKQEMVEAGWVLDMFGLHQCPECTAKRKRDE